MSPTRIDRCPVLNTLTEFRLSVGLPEMVGAVQLVPPSVVYRENPPLPTKIPLSETPDEVADAFSWVVPAGLLVEVMFTG